MTIPVADGPDVYGYTIFCDDIRVEAAGKLIYIGAYGGEMIVHGSFPVVLPRFSMHFFYFQKRPHVVPPSKIIISTPGNTEDNPAFTMDIPNADEMTNANVEPSEDNMYLMATAPINLSNFQILEEGFIRVRALRNDRYIRLGSLRVLQNPAFKTPVNDTKEAAN